MLAILQPSGDFNSVDIFGQKLTNFISEFFKNSQVNAIQLIFNLSIRRSYHSPVGYAYADTYPGNYDSDAGISPSSTGRFTSFPSFITPSH